MVVVVVGCRCLVQGIYTTCFATMQLSVTTIICKKRACALSALCGLDFDFNNGIKKAKHSEARKHEVKSKEVPIAMNTKKKKKGKEERKKQYLSHAFEIKTWKGKARLRLVSCLPTLLIMLFGPVEGIQRLFLTFLTRPWFPACRLVAMPGLLTG